MSMRFPSGFNRPGYDPLKVPNAPTIGTATGGDASASVSFTPPSNVGGSAISAYYAVANDGTTGTASSSPVTVSGLTNGTSYTFQVWALNTYGPGVWSAASGSVTPVAAFAWFFPSVNSSSTYPTGICKMSLSSGGLTSDFGTMYSTGYPTFSVSNSIYAIIGNNGGFATLTLASGGTATNFGATTPKGGSCGNATRAIMQGFYDNTLAYTTFAATGTWSDFGDLTVAGANGAGCGSSTRGIMFVGKSTNVINYLTIASTGNAADFGDSIFTLQEMGSGSNSVRGIVSGGFGTGNSIEYITIATTGNAVDFGDYSYVSNARYSQNVAASSIECFIGGSGSTTTTLYTNVQKITIASTGNAVDFSNMQYATAGGSAVSNVHGGL